MSFFNLVIFSLFSIFFSSFFSFNRGDQNILATQLEASSQLQLRWPAARSCFTLDSGASPPDATATNFDVPCLTPPHTGFAATPDLALHPCRLPESTPHMLTLPNQRWHSWPRRESLTMTRASERAALDGERSWQKMGDFLASMGGGGRKVAVVSPILVGSEPK